MSEDTNLLDEIYLDLSFIPEYLLDEVQYWFVPSRESPRAVYHELFGESAKNWSAYYTKKGWDFIHETDAGGREGPFRVRDGGVHLDIVAPGKFFAPKPQVRLSAAGRPIPLLSHEKHKPVNPWKPNYVQALNFIKKYSWPHDLSRCVVLAMWEIEECGQVAGSTSWVNGEQVLLANDSKALRETLGDFFFKRPEDYDLGSQVYLRVLGRLGREEEPGETGFDVLTELAKHPVARKRWHVARALGELGEARGVQTLLMLVDDEDFAVRDAALQALTRIGVNASVDPESRVASFLESDEGKHRVWAASALLRGGDESQRKFLIQLVKEDSRPLSELGDLGRIIVDLELFDTVPFLIKRFRSGAEDVVIDAAETLGHVTGIESDYSVVDDAELKRGAVKGFERWWDDFKKERSKRRADDESAGDAKKKNRE